MCVSVVVCVCVCVIRDGVTHRPRGLPGNINRAVSGISSESTGGNCRKDVVFLMLKISTYRSQCYFTYHEKDNVR